jgi:signal transduction histidine kinase
MVQSNRDMSFAMFRRWGALKLVHQFAIAAALVLIPGMAAIGFWVTDRITRAVTTNTAQAAALYMEGSVAPLIQELAASQDLRAETIEQLDSLLQHSTIRDRVVSMKIWRLDGTIVYSQWKDIIGRRFAPSINFTRAAAGAVAAGFDTEPHQEDHHERAMANPLLEIYAPVRAQNSREVIAVSEFYARGDQLQAELVQAKVLSWLVVAAVTCLMMAALAGIVNRGSKMIASQESQLTSKIDNLHVLLGQNEDLRLRLHQTNQQISASSEAILQKIGADLHDGPAQLLTYALLRLNKIGPKLDQGSGDQNSQELEKLRTTLVDSLREIRGISAGLAPPGLEAASLHDTVRLAISHHQQRTSTAVRLCLDGIDIPVPPALKVCVYRFVQEALNNAYRHAGGKGQAVYSATHGTLVISISDAGPGFDPSDKSNFGLGLSGMRARVEALGGSISFRSQPDSGMTISAEFNLTALDCDESSYVGPNLEIGHHS